MKKRRKVKKLKKTKKQRKKQKKPELHAADLIIRYGLALALSVNSLFIFYYIFRPLTFYPVSLILKLFYSANLSGLELLTINGYKIWLVDACVAGSAYYLLVLLNLTTRGIATFKRIKIFFLDAASLLALNIIRIVILAVLLIELPILFDVTHSVFWYVISIAFVIFIWLFTIKVYKIKAIPVWSDILHLKSLMKR